jgi:hypothetical protein
MYTCHREGVSLKRWTESILEYLLLNCKAVELSGQFGINSTIFGFT